MTGAPADALVTVVSACTFRGAVTAPSAMVLAMRMPWDDRNRIKKLHDVNVPRWPGDEATSCRDGRCRKGEYRRTMEILSQAVIALLYCAIAGGILFLVSSSLFSHEGTSRGEAALRIRKYLASGPATLILSLLLFSIYAILGFPEQGSRRGGCSACPTITLGRSLFIPFCTPTFSTFSETSSCCWFAAG